MFILESNNTDKNRDDLLQRLLNPIFEPNLGVLQVTPLYSMYVLRPYCEMKIVTSDCWIKKFVYSLRLTT